MVIEKLILRVASMCDDEGETAAVSLFDDLDLSSDPSFLSVEDICNASCRERDDLFLPEI